MGLAACGGTKGTPDASVDARVADAAIDAAPDAAEPDAAPQADAAPDGPTFDAGPMVDACVPSQDCVDVGASADGDYCLDMNTTIHCAEVAPGCFQETTKDTCSAATGTGPDHLQSCVEGTCQCQNADNCTVEGDTCDTNAAPAGRFHCAADTQGCLYKDADSTCDKPLICDGAAGSATCICPPVGDPIEGGGCSALGQPACSVEEGVQKQLTCTAVDVPEGSQPPASCNVWEVSDDCDTFGLTCNPTNAQCECPANLGTDEYANARPEIDKIRSEDRPHLQQTGVRFPTICEFETMTVALDNAIDKTGIGHSGVARVFADNMSDNCKSQLDLAAHDACVADATACPDGDPHPECAHDLPVVFGPRRLPVPPDQGGGDRVVREEYPWIIFQNITVSTVEDSAAAGSIGGADDLNRKMFELIVDNSVRGAGQLAGLPYDQMTASITLKGSVSGRTGFGGSLRGLWIHEGDAGDCMDVLNPPEVPPAAKLPGVINPPDPEGPLDCNVYYTTAVNVLDFGLTSGVTQRLDRTYIDGGWGTRIGYPDAEDDTHDVGTFKVDTATHMVTYTPADDVDLTGYFDGDGNPLQTLFISFQADDGSAKHMNHAFGAFLVLSADLSTKGILSTLTYYDPDATASSDKYSTANLATLTSSSYSDVGNWWVGVRVGSDATPGGGADGVFQDIAVVNFATLPTSAPLWLDNGRVGVWMQNDFDDQTGDVLINVGGKFIQNDTGWLIEQGTSYLTDAAINGKVPGIAAGTPVTYILSVPTVDASLWQGVAINQAGESQVEGDRTNVTMNGVIVSNTFGPVNDCEFPDARSPHGNGINLFWDAKLTMNDGLIDGDVAFPDPASPEADAPNVNTVRNNAIAGLTVWNGDATINGTSFYMNGWGADEYCTLGNGVTIFDRSNDGDKVELIASTELSNYDNGVWLASQADGVNVNLTDGEIFGNGVEDLEGGQDSHVLDDGETPVTTATLNDFYDIGISGNGILSNANSTITTDMDTAGVLIKGNGMAGIYMTDGFLNMGNATVTDNAQNNIEADTCDADNGEAHVMAVQVYDRARFLITDSKIDANQGGGLLVDTLGGLFISSWDSNGAPKFSDTGDHHHNSANAIAGGSVTGNLGKNDCDDNYFHAGGNYNTKTNKHTDDRLSDAVVVTIDGRLQFIQDGSGAGTEVDSNLAYGLNVSGLVDFPDDPGVDPNDRDVNFVDNRGSGFPNSGTDISSDPYVPNGIDTSVNNGGARVGLNLDGNSKAGLFVSCDVDGKACSQLESCWSQGEPAETEDEYVGLTGECLAGVECGNVYLSGGSADHNGEQGALVWGSLFASQTSFSNNGPADPDDTNAGVYIDAQKETPGTIGGCICQGGSCVFEGPYDPITTDVVNCVNNVGSYRDTIGLLDGKTELVKVNIAGNHGHGVRAVSAPYHVGINPPTNVNEDGCVCSEQGVCAPDPDVEGAHCDSWADSTASPDWPDGLDEIENPIGLIAPGIVLDGNWPRDTGWGFVIRGADGDNSDVHDNVLSGVSIGSDTQACQVWAEVGDGNIVENGDLGIDVRQNLLFNFNYSSSSPVCDEHNNDPTKPKCVHCTLNDTQMPSDFNGECDVNANCSEDTPYCVDGLCTAAGQTGDVGCTAVTVVSNKLYLNGTAQDRSLHVSQGGVHFRTAFQKGITFRDGRAFTSNSISHNAMQAAPMCDDTDQYAPQMWVDGPIGVTAEYSVCNNYTNQEVNCRLQNRPDMSENGLNNHCIWHNPECRVAWDIAGGTDSCTDANLFYHYTGNIGSHLQDHVGLFVNDGGAVLADYNEWQFMGSSTDDWHIASAGQDTIWAPNQCGATPTFCEANDLVTPP